MIYFQEVITSRNNPTVKWASSLTQKKGRDENKSFIAEGEKLTLEALSSGVPVTHVFVEESKYETIVKSFASYEDDARYSNTAVYKLSEGAFSKISTEKAPQGVISVIKYLDFFRNMDIIYKEEFFLKDNERALFLFFNFPAFHPAGR